MKKKTNLSSYLGFDLGHVEGEIDTGGKARYGLASCRNAPAYAEIVQNVELVVHFVYKINAIQPALIILPSLPRQK